MAKSILLADINPMTRARVHAAAQEIGAELHLANDAEEALAHARRLQPDLFLANLSLPGPFSENLRRWLSGPKKTPAVRTLVFGPDPADPRLVRIHAPEIEKAALDGEESGWTKPVVQALAEADLGTHAPGPDANAARDPRPPAYEGIPQLSQGLPATGPPGGPTREILENVTRKALEELADRVCSQVIERVEQIAWEVVPEITETLVREEVRKLCDVPARTGSAQQRTTPSNA